MVEKQTVVCWYQCPHHNPNSHPEGGDEEERTCLRKPDPRDGEFQVMAAKSEWAWENSKTFKWCPYSEHPELSLGIKLEALNEKIEARTPGYFVVASIDGRMAFHLIGPDKKIHYTRDRFAAIEAVALH